MNRSWTFTRWTGVAAVAVLAVVALIGAWLALRDDPRVRHEALSGEWSSADVPGTVAEQAWEWSAEEAWGVSRLSPLPGGVLVGLEDGVVALDGASGHSWSLIEGCPPLPWNSGLSSVTASQANVGTPW